MLNSEWEIPLKTGSRFDGFQTTWPCRGNPQFPSDWIKYSLDSQRLFSYSAPLVLFPFLPWFSINTNITISVLIHCLNCFASIIMWVFSCTYFSFFPLYAYYVFYIFANFNQIRTNSVKVFEWQELKKRKSLVRQGKKLCHYSFGQLSTCFSSILVHHCKYNKWTTTHIRKLNQIKKKKCTQFFFLLSSSPAGSDKCLQIVQHLAFGIGNIES